MKNYLLGVSLVLASSLSYGQSVLWGVGSAFGVAHAEFQTTIITSTSSTPYAPNSWTARTVSDNNGANTPGNAFWSRTTLGYSQGINSDGVVLGSPSQANGAAIFDSDFLDNGGIVGNEGNGASPANQRGELISPQMDFTGYTDSVAIVKMFLKYSADSINELSLSFSTDGGNTWGPAKDLRASHSNNAEGFSSAWFEDEMQGITNLSDCRIKFTFDGAYNYAMLDDISIRSANGIYPIYSTHVAYSTVSELSCTNSYTSPSGNYTWTSPGVYYDTIPTFIVTDSLMTIHLSFGTPTTGVDVQTACGSYTWIDGNTYTQSNSTATHTILNVSGCDSLVTLNLTLNTVDITTSLNNNAILSNESNGTYRWLDCDNGYAVIAGATDQSYIPTNNGNYAVEVTANGCVDTSACVLIDAAGIGENELSHSIKTYPNPTAGTMTVDFNKQMENVHFQLTTIGGEIVFNEHIKNCSEYSFDIDGATGMYFLRVITENSNQVVKVVKK